VWSISCVVEAAKPFQSACARERSTAIGIADRAIGFFRFRRLASSANPALKQFVALN
jgi:hypothetical protein